MHFHKVKRRVKPSHQKKKKMKQGNTRICTHVLTTQEEQMLRLAFKGKSEKKTKKHVS